MEKIKLIWAFIIYHTLYIQEAPGSEYNRQWRRWIATFKNESFVAVSYELQITQFKGQPMTPRPAIIRQIGIEFNPTKWEFTQEHTYYDGNHCQYNLGPICYYTSGAKHCDLCSND